MGALDPHDAEPEVGRAGVYAHDDLHQSVILAPPPDASFRRRMRAIRA
jgi:hypothetical protein